MSSRFRISVFVALALAGGLFSAAFGQTPFEWQSAVSGSWFTNTLWTPSTAYPNSATTDIATISRTGAAYTVTANGAAIGVLNLNVSSPDATLVFNFASSSSVLTLGSGTSSFSAGGVEYQTGSGIVGAGSGLTTLSLAAGAALQFTTATNTRSLTTLTLSNSGTVEATSGVLSISGNASVANQTGGLIHANNAEIAFQSGATVTNAGTLRATGAAGVLRFNGALTTANLGTVDLVSGGRALIQGSLTNTAATLAVPGAGSFELRGGTITGGIIAEGALKFTSSGGTLSGVTLAGDVTTPASSHVYFTNGTLWSGSSLTLGSSSSIYWQQPTALAGKTLTFGSGSYIYVSGGTNGFSLDSASSATGDITLYTDGDALITNAGTISHTSTASGLIYAASLTNSGTIETHAGPLQVGTTNSSYGTSNSGMLVADGTSSSSYGTLYLDGNVENTGSIVAEDYGRIYFRGENTSANLGSITLQTNGRVFFSGTLTNNTRTLTAPSGGMFELSGGTIQGGTVNENALTFTSGGGTLSGVSWAGNLALPNSTHVYFAGGTTFSGANLTLGDGASIYWQQVDSLSGKALTFGSGASIYVSGGGNALTLAADSTATGDISLYTDSSAGTSISNAGSITHTSATGGSIYSLSFTNSGSITASAGWLQIGSTTSSYNTTNTGSIKADGTSSSSYSTVYLDGNFANTGTVTAEDYGRLIFRGANTTANLGAVQIGANGHAYLNGTLDNSNTTLPTPTGGKFELYGGTIANGSVSANALTFTSSGGKLSGVTWTGDLALPDSSRVDLTGNTSFTGTNLSLGTSAGIYWEQVGTLAGKVLTFDSHAYIYVRDTNNALTLDAATTATGDIDIYTSSSLGTAITNAGSITHTSTNGGQINALSLTNSGSITATKGWLQIGSTSSGYNTTNSGSIKADGTSSSDHGTIYLDGNVANTGTIVAEDYGVVYIRGTNTTANLGTVQVGANGHVYLNGTLNNTGATLSAPSLGKFELYSGEIENGTVDADALTFTNGGGTLSNVAWSGDFSLPSSTHVNFTNNTTISGTTLTLGNNATIYWDQNASLTGKALTFGTGALIYVFDESNGLTLGAGSTAAGDISIYTDGSSGTFITNQGTITHTAGYGNLYARTLTNDVGGTIKVTDGTLSVGSSASTYVTTNSGTLEADGATADLSLYSVDNTNGTIRAKNGGEVILDGTWTPGRMGTVEIETNGHVFIDGLVNNATTLNAPATGSYELRYGTISGGTIASGALTFSGYYGTLDGVTISGNFTLPMNSGVHFENSSGFTGTSASLGSNAYLYWNQSGTWLAKAISFGANSVLYVMGANQTLTFDADTTATGDIAVVSDGSDGTVFTNEGTITHTGGTGNIYADTVANAGTIAVSSGTLYVGSTSTGASFSNQAGASLVVSGTGNLVLQAPAATQLVNLGTIDVQAGTLYTNNQLTNGLGGILRGAGTISGGITMSGGTLAPGNSGIGTLTFSSGNFAITHATTFEVQLSGTTADQIVFQYPSSVVDIGSGLLTLSLTLLSEPVADATYNLIRIGAGTQTITGHFAGLANSGDTLTAMFNGNPFTFAVNYQPTVISLSFTPVPEPETYASLGLGAIVVWLMARRRRRAR